MEAPSTLRGPLPSQTSDDADSFDLPDDEVDEPKVRAGARATPFERDGETQARVRPLHATERSAFTQAEADASERGAATAVAGHGLDVPSVPSAGESGHDGKDGDPTTLATARAPRATRAPRSERSSIDALGGTHSAPGARPVRMVRDGDATRTVGDAPNDADFSTTSASRLDAGRHEDCLRAGHARAASHSNDEEAGLVGTHPLILPKRTPESERIVETPLMLETMSRTLNVHLNSPIVVWTGPSRNGKTQTAKWLVRKLDAVAKVDPDGFRAKHYQYGGASGTGAAERKNVLRSVYTATIARLDEGEFRQMPIEHLALKCAIGLHAQNVQMLLVDEAGLLGVDGLRALVMLRDVASDHHRILSIVLIGMDNLPHDLAQLPQIERRVHEWCYFEPYALDETEALVRGLMPEYPELTLATAEGLKMLKFLHKHSSGLPGLLTPLLSKVRAALQLMDARPTLSLIEGTHMRTQRDKGKAERAGKARAAGASALELGMDANP